MFGIRYHSPLHQSEVPALSISKQSISGAVIKNSYQPLLILYYFFRPATLRPASSFMHLDQMGGAAVQACSASSSSPNATVHLQRAIEEDLQLAKGSPIKYSESGTAK